MLLMNIMYYIIIIYINKILFFSYSPSLQIWGNIQRTQDLNLLQFDFMRRSDWHSLFNNNISAPSNSMQHKLNYISANTLMNDLEFHIEKKLRKKILRLRRTVKTTWNHYVSNQLKNYITNIENNYTSNKYDISHIGGIEHGESVSRLRTRFIVVAQDGARYLYTVLVKNLFPPSNF